MKRLIVLITAMILCFSLAGCNDELSKEDIISLVNDNKDTILQDVSEGDFSDCEKVSHFNK